MRKFSIIIILTCLFKAVYSIPAGNHNMLEDKLKGIIPLTDGKAAYTQTVDCGNVTLTELFRRARLWMAMANPENQVSVSDKETGDLAGYGTAVISMSQSESSVGGVYSFRYTLMVECANRKYRSSIRNILVQQNGNVVPIELFNLKSDQETKDLFTALDKKMNLLLQDLELNVKEYKAF